MSSYRESSDECACFVAEFEGSKAGKINTLFFQVINDGGDVVSDSFDILVPGMGVGMQQQGCPNQWKGTDMSKWGAQYGGLDKNAQGCKNLPKDLQRGCLWRMSDWGDSVNLKAPPKRVRCSKAHIDRSGCQRKDEPNAIFQGRHDADAAPAPDGYTPNASVCGIGSPRRSTRHKAGPPHFHRL